MQGLADGSGLPFDTVVQIHMIPEAVKAHCSMVGAWGAAISNTSGSLYQLRALDWSTDGPFQQYPQVTVYHPEDGNGHAFSILTWCTSNPLTSHLLTPSQLALLVPLLDTAVALLVSVRRCG
jgi:hypothetical protein